jgi:hypothetical protein
VLVSAVKRWGLTGLLEKIAQFLPEKAAPVYSP